MAASANLRLVETASIVEDEPDGRRRRSQDSRARIVAAMLDLIREGEVSPGAEQVALRAGVGLRTVFRHFNDMDSLYSEIAGAIKGVLFAAIAEPFVGQTWRERVVEIVWRRGKVYDQIAPFKRAAEVQRHRSPYLASVHEQLFAGQREILHHQLPTDAAADPLLFETVDLLLSYEAWNRLRSDQGLEPDVARAVLEGAVRRAIAA